MSEIPDKKWFEIEKRREIFLFFPIDLVRDRLMDTITAGGLKRKNFWSGKIKCKGSVMGNFLDMSIRIPSGKADLRYHVYGELASHLNGCLINVVIRDRNPFYAALTVAALITIVFFQGGVGIGIFGILFFGSFATAALVVQHNLGISAVAKALQDCTENPQ